MIKRAEDLVPGDRRSQGTDEWIVEGAELQDGMMQVLWRCGEERRWDEYDLRTPMVVTPAASAGRTRLVKNAAALHTGDVYVGEASPPFVVRHVERTDSLVVVEWSNGTAIRVREYEPTTGVLVESDTITGV